MPRSIRRWGLAASVVAVTLAVAPVSQAISLCIDCTCASACDLRCWNGFAVDTCSHWLCVDFCFPSPLSPETAAVEEAAPSTGESPPGDESPGYGSAPDESGFRECGWSLGG